MCGCQRTCHLLVSPCRLLDDSIWWLFMWYNPLNYPDVSAPPAHCSTLEWASPSLPQHLCHFGDNLRSNCSDCCHPVCWAPDYQGPACQSDGLTALCTICTVAPRVHQCMAVIGANSAAAGAHWSGPMLAANTYTSWPHNLQLNWLLTQTSSTTQV